MGPVDGVIGEDGLVGRNDAILKQISKVEHDHALQPGGANKVVAHLADLLEKSAGVVVRHVGLAAGFGVAERGAKF